MPAAVPWSAQEETPAALDDRPPAGAPTDVAPEQSLPRPEAERQPEPERRPEAERQPEPEPEPEPHPVRRSEPTWPERDESTQVRGDATQVLPTSWAPPEPAASDRAAELDPAVGRVTVSLAHEEEAETEADEPASTAEQAVPWLIGVILLLAGMVIVLLALIFAGDASLGTSGAVPSGSALTGLASADAIASIPSRPSLSPTPTPTDAPSPSTTASPQPTPTAVPPAEYGALEMVYQGRSAALAPIYLLRRDFTKDEDTQQVLAQDPSLDVRRYAWSPDGTVGAGLLADVLVSIEPGEEKRRLADGISTVTFGADASTLYAVRVTQDGANDVARILEINFASGAEAELAAPTYERPAIGEEDALSEAQFTDEGGPVRLYSIDGGMLRFWALGAGTWQINPGDGSLTELEEDDRPTLWAPDAERRIRTSFEDGSSTLSLLDAADEELLAVTIEGRVSHVRWAPDGERIAFTAGRSNAGGGVLQDLFLWDLNEEDPMQLTATGAAFGAEWLGAPALWKD